MGQTLSEEELNLSRIPDLFNRPARDWWRYVGCRTCNAPVQAACYGRGPHRARVRSGLAVHGVLWLVTNGFADDVLGSGPEDARNVPGAPAEGEVGYGSTGDANGAQNAGNEVRP